VQGTWGAQFHPDLVIRQGDLIVNKGQDSTLEAYSGFQGTDLESWLRERQIRNVYIAGLTTDYCVFTTAMDSLKAGFEVWVLEDAIAGVDVPPGSAAAALRTLKESGVHLITTKELPCAHTSQRPG